MKLEFQLESTWPPLAWLAEFNRDEDVVRVRHGAKVETGDAWFAEAVWNGPFEDKQFDQTDVVFGSAAKVTGDKSLVFVSSSSTLDRLCYLERGNDVFVSNSVVCLIAITDAELDPFYKRYPTDFKSIIHGPENYRRPLKTSVGEMHIVYVDNLAWRQGRFERVKKPTIRRERNTFEKYKVFLETELCLLAKNMSSPARANELCFLGTASSGFDSPTVCALARKAGLKEVISFDSSRGNKEDSGAEISRILKLESSIHPREGWKERELVEVSFLASDAKGEDVYFAETSELLNGRVLLTGYCGSIWGGRSRSYFQLKRTDQSGLSLTEHRLWAGCLNVPVPVIGVHGAEDLLKLMASPEAEQLSNGNSYDKPFCRSVLQGAGVPDDLYGIEKKAASVLIHDRASFLTTSSRADFKQFLHEKLRGKPLKQFGLNIEVAASSFARVTVRTVVKIADRLSKIVPLKVLNRVANSVRFNEFANGEPTFKYLYPWAIEHARKRYLIHEEDTSAAENRSPVSSSINNPSEV